MSKRLVFSIATVSAILLGLSMYSYVNAEQSGGDDEFSDSRKASIVDGCVPIKTVLKKIHENDGLSRVNLGQHYELLASGLMTPMNSRIVDNQLDGSEMIATTSRYSESVSQFRDAYIEYERQLSTTISIDCREDPKQFYESLEKTRQLRTDVRQQVVAANTAIKDYFAAFTSFKDTQLDKQDEGQHNEQ